MAGRHDGMAGAQLAQAPIVAWLPIVEAGQRGHGHGKAQLRYRLEPLLAETERERGLVAELASGCARLRTANDAARRPRPLLLELSGRMCGGCVSVTAEGNDGGSGAPLTLMPTTRVGASTAVRRAELTGTWTGNAAGAPTPALDDDDRPSDRGPKRSSPANEAASAFATATLALPPASLTLPALDAATTSRWCRRANACWRVGAQTSMLHVPGFTFPLATNSITGYSVLARSPGAPFAVAGEATCALSAGGGVPAAPPALGAVRATLRLGKWGSVAVAREPPLSAAVSKARRRVRHSCRHPSPLPPASRDPWLLAVCLKLPCALAKSKLQLNVDARRCEPWGIRLAWSRRSQRIEFTSRRAAAGARSCARRIELKVSSGRWTATVRPASMELRRRLNPSAAAPRCEVHMSTAGLSAARGTGTTCRGGFTMHV